MSKILLAVIFTLCLFNFASSTLRLPCPAPGVIRMCPDNVQLCLYTTDGGRRQTQGNIWDLCRDPKVDYYHYGACPDRSGNQGHFRRF